MGEEIIFQKGDFIVKLVRDMEGEMLCISIKVRGEISLNEDEAIELQWSINKFTGHI